MSAIGLNVNEMNPHSKTSLSRNILPSRGSAQRARGSFCALLTLASLIFSPPTFANPTHQNVEDILKLSDISAPQFSPSGRWIAFSRYQINPDANSRYTLHYLYDTQSATFKTLSGVGTKLGWRPKRDFLLFVSEGTGAKTINQINPESLASEVWLTLPGKAANIKIAPNEQNLYYTASYECQSTQPGEKTYRAKPCNSLYRIKLATQQTEKLLELKTFIQNYDISPTGMLALEIIPEAALNRQLTDIALLDPEKPQLQWIILDSGLDMGPNWSPDGRYMAYLSSGNQDAWSSQYHLRVWDSRTQKTKTLTSPQEGNIANLIWKLDSSGVYYTKAQSVNKEIWFSNLSGKDMRVSSGDVLIENFDLNPSNQTHMSFPLENMNQPKELYFNGKIITNFNFHNRTQNLGETRVVEWRSNGQTLDGLLTLPPDYVPGKPLPTVVVLHGGPADNFTRRFSGSRYAFPVQVLASQGYAVFRPNPHGSGNYGQKFSDAILKDWGGIDLEDILSGTQFLIDQKIADPKRIAVGGWSYGGYLAALASSQSKFFKTCVVGAGITSLWSYIGQVDVDEFVETYMGAPEHNAKLYTERSPVSFVHRVKAPTLLIYGADDDRVPEEQGLEYFRGLKRNGVQTELWVIPQMGHRLSNPNHYRQVTDKIVGWLKQYL